jgi:hypothetical protein
MLRATDLHFYLWDITDLIAVFEIGPVAKNTVGVLSP